MGFLDTLKDKILIIDGATGTMIQKFQLGNEFYGGEQFKMFTDIINFSSPEVVKEIHKSYFEVGADAIETNTFGSSYLRMMEYDLSKLDTSIFPKNPYSIKLQTISPREFSYYLSRRGAEIAVEAREEYKKNSKYDGRELFILGSIGPSNFVLTYSQAGLKQATFEQIRENFYIQAKGLIEGGVDALLFETQQDILELKAGIFGARDAMRCTGRYLPIITQVTVDQFARMQIFNTDILSALVSLQALNIDVFGINCSIGPDLMLPAVEKMSRYANVPLSIVPNAGLPENEGGKTVFKFEPKKFASILEELVLTYGINITGGCCGTTPEHIGELVERLRGKKPRVRKTNRTIFIAGVQKAIELDASQSLIRIGERLNVRGSKKVREAVENESGLDMDTLESVAREQIEDLGCEIIDVCMDSNQVNTLKTLCKVVHQISASIKGALCIDSFQPDALIEAVKYYAGVPILNSVSLEEIEPGRTKLDLVIPATREFGTFYVALCTDSKGPADTAEQKLALAKKIVESAKKYDVPPYKLFIDVNVFPIGSESDVKINFALETLKGIELVRKELPECFTIIGVGNLTNGLSQKPHMRKVLTSVFLDEARKRGLHSAILNPQHYVFVENLDPEDYTLALKVIFERDMEAFSALEEKALKISHKEIIRKKDYDSLPLEKAICEKIKDGYKEKKEGVVELNGFTYNYSDSIVSQVARVLEKIEPLEFVNKYLMPAMEELGESFGKGDVSLPHLLRSADVLKQAMGFIEAYIRFTAKSSEAKTVRGTVVLGTVFQDVHSIGKDLTKTLLENYGYKVIDLGVMVPLQDFIDQAKKNKADAIGMSALLVQTANHMITVAKMSVEQGLNIPILVGGAAVTPRHASFVAMMGQDDIRKIKSDVFYCRTAMDGVNIMNQLTSSRETREYLISHNKETLIQRYIQAIKRSSEEVEKLQKLPRRAIKSDFPDYPDQPWFRCKAIKFSLSEFLPFIDRTNLFSLNWKFGGKTLQKKAGHSDEELESLLRHWIKLAEKNNWIIPQGIYGLFPALSEEDTLIIYNPTNTTEIIGRIEFTKVIGSGEEDIVSGAQYFRPIGSKKFDVVGIQVTTAGKNIEEGIEFLKTNGDSEGCLLLQGLGDRIAEDMAEYVNNILREILNLPKGQGCRWSPGYPGIINIEMNKVILECLGSGDLIGVTVLPSGQFKPTATTGAVVSFHPDARYN
ncbi:MAG: homocysteine S-methyltransferase family protein [Candidatus Hydrogenedentes bacterium]|nr:homocysteine S-methyltransferase family protein [Candidatus Hydrogenedentota bacterium]